ncbi:MAG: PAS domain S-box protein [Synechococcaceae cyanobacterium SM1_2_3]|nr:PAS domain S-box protein [Synechococcaceae cyanobacterium SM1_2_3]
MTDYSRFSRDELIAKLRIAEMELQRIRAAQESGNRPTDCVGDSLAAVELRRCALERWQAQPMSASRPPTEAESLRLIHELHVHQIELELQNEELRETQARLERSLERYTDLYDFAPIGYFTLTGDGVIHEVNFAGAALLGQARSQLIGAHFGRWVAVASRPTFTVFLDRLVRCGSQEICEVTLEPEGAPPRYVRLVGRVSGADRCCRLVAVDITDRKQAEEALRAHEQQLSAVLRVVPVAVGVSVQHIFQQVNDYFYQALGYRPEEIIGQSTRLIFPSDGSFERLDREIQNQIERTGLAVVEAQTHGKDGRLIDILLQVALLVPNQPESGRVFCALDITERKRMETALCESEERFRLFMDHSPTVTWIKDEEGRWIYLNKNAMCNFTG